MFKPEKFKGKKACVLGLGRSGRYVAKLLADHGFKVLISEEHQPTHIPDFPAHISVETGGHTSQVFTCGFIVKSPGIFPKSPVLKEAKKRKIPVFSELEVALSFMPAGIEVLAVSGTNGKTTTTSLLGEILKEYCAQKQPQRQVFVTGNIGKPVSSVSNEIKKGDFLVLEVSSYQLEDSTFFRPNVACLLNITPDHLDHHGGMINYMKAKARLFSNQRRSDIAILNGADPFCAALARQIKAQLGAFSAQPNHALKTDVFYDGDEIIFSMGYRLRPPKLKGIHNVENAMAAALCALAVGVGPDVIQKAFDRFEPMEHRIEPFAYHRGVIYINDSKATNLDSTVIALKSFEKTKNIWLILGGRDKGASYSVLAPYVHDHCKGILTIGESMDKIEQELKTDVPIVRGGDLKTVVDYLFQTAEKGDIVLLSPACASFDQFKSYEERGRIFKELVNTHIKKARQ
ncbi:MAG: UDP-N-acetylmuramoyl-L-alanine--D-glutamate ligase [Elusimicrobiaceae bacterium]|nr:UDP-N-acetylmuramoyl-L-alanine--D-glutamate ligase [Elusimicrobiaceae bacterium]